MKNFFKSERVKGSQVPPFTPKAMSEPSHTKDILPFAPALIKFCPQGRKLKTCGILPLDENGKFMQTYSEEAFKSLHNLIATILKEQGMDIGNVNKLYFVIPKKHHNAVNIELLKKWLAVNFPSLGDDKIKISTAGLLANAPIEVMASAFKQEHPELGSSQVPCFNQHRYRVFNVNPNFAFEQNVTNAMASIAKFLQSQNLNSTDITQAEMAISNPAHFQVMNAIYRQAFKPEEGFPIRITTVNDNLGPTGFEITIRAAKYDSLPTVTSVPPTLSK